MRAAKDSEKRIDRAAEAASDGEKLITMSSDLRGILTHFRTSN
jgi:hypothetical protein